MPKTHILAIFECREESVPLNFQNSNHYYSFIHSNKLPLQEVDRTIDHSSSGCGLCGLLPGGTTDDIPEPRFTLRQWSVEFGGTAGRKIGKRSTTQSRNTTASTNRGFVPFESRGGGCSGDSSRHRPRFPSPSWFI